MRVTAKVDYAVRAAIELARHAPADGSRPRPMKGEQVAIAQEIPRKFLENILAELKRSGIVGSVRGADGGYWLTRSPDRVSIADIIRAVEGPLADVRGVRPEELDYADDLEVLQRTWVAVRANLRAVLEHVTLADLIAGHLDPTVEQLATEGDAWSKR
ncbi:MAG: Rrf2 family transcriptional regulator [Acidimicrobiales bacterium]|nr:Rrf2 family transcriptional regulator [Acidimicrobiales bacterium]